MMSDEIVTVLQRSGVTDVLSVSKDSILQCVLFLFFQVANKNALTNHLAFWEAIMIRRTALDQLKDGLRHHNLLTAVQLFPDSFEYLFTFKGYITAEDVLSCLDLAGLNPSVCAMLNTYLCSASHQG